MSFWQTVAASGFGAFFGFLGALAVFLVQEWQKNHRRDAAIVQNLKLEIDYNVNLYEKFEKQIQDCIEAISNDSKALYLNLDYQFVGTHFAKQFYQNGLLLKYFHPEDMRRWNIMLNQIGTGTDTYVCECVDKWREDKEIKKEDVYKALKHEKSQISYAKEMSEYIKSKL